MKDEQWWDKSWNPVSGCSPCSIGCKFCWAKAMAHRFGNDDFSVKPHPERLDKPLHWRKPRRIFVVSMGDLFHPKVPFEFTEKVFAIIRKCPQHTFLVLTKRPEGMAEYIGGVWRDEDSPSGFGSITMIEEFPNIHLGVSISTQAEADKKIPILLQIPAAVRWLSIEPMLEPLDILSYPQIDTYQAEAFSHYGPPDWFKPKCRGIDWVVIGAESIGSHVGRECKLEWVRDIVRQCDAAGAPVHIKQLHINGRLEKGIAEFPKDLQRRELPNEQ